MLDNGKRIPLSKGLTLGKVVPGFPSYRVSSEGVVYSSYRKSYWKALSPRLKSNGYHIVSIRDEQGVKKTIGIHQLVAITYIPNPENKPCVCHLDSIRSNNCVSNLYWGTYKENTKQMVEEGKHYVPSPKLTPLQEKALVNEYKSGKYTYDTLSQKYHISRMLLYQVLKKFGEVKNGKHKPNQGRYPCY